MLILGIGFFVVIVGFAQLLVIPPSDYVPTGITPAAPGAPGKRQDFTPGEMLRTWQFYILWFMFVCGSGAGLMIISKIAKLAEVQANLKLGFLLVAILALGNGSGRFIGGTVSDMIGRKATMFICFVFQTILILLLSQIKAGNMLGTVQVLSTISFFIGANYGANIALFPSINKDYYGIKNFGANYGLMFTAWGLGGFMLSLLAGWVYDTTGTFAFAYYCSAGLLIVAAIVTFFVKPPQYKPSIVINEGLEPEVVIDK
jgi:OFA family oxalate/formate antiporter-like MFS transporter